MLTPNPPSPVRRRCVAALLVFAMVALIGSGARIHAAALYATFTGSGTVEVFNPDTGQSLGTFATGFQLPTGLAFDPSGNLFVADLGQNAIVKILPDGTKSLFASIGLNRPMGLAFGPSGDLYVANDGNSTISKITPDGVVTVFGDGGDLNAPKSLASDSSGNVYAANAGGTTVTRTTQAGSTSSFAIGLDTPHGLAFDSVGTLFVVEHLSSVISKIASDGTVTPFVTGLVGGYPSSLAFDDGANLFIAYSDTDIIGRITPDGVETRFTIASTPYFLAIGPDPIPEPSALVLAITAGARVGFVPRRRRVVA